MSERNFAIMDTNNIVTNVVVMDVDSESQGIQEIRNNANDQNLIVAETWVDASDSSQRYNYAGKGFTWDANNNAFYNVQPFTSWSLNANYEWVAPTPYPDKYTAPDGTQVWAAWQEDNLRWVSHNENEEVNYIWNPTTLIWDIA
jgi:hypothetical protein|tara:strand:- start:3 stop:434 length:432 start_codon:yes stop_codon:yes gene_type:complete